MKARGRVAIMLSDETSRVGFVAAYRVAPFPECRLDRVRDNAQATRSIAIADYDVGARALVLRTRRRRHGVAIHEDCGSEFTVDSRHELAQCPVIGLVKSLDPPQRLVD